jgi:hypothetical protein
LPDPLRLRVELVCVELVADVPEELEEEEEEEVFDEELSVLDPVEVLVCVVEVALEDSVAEPVQLEEVCVMSAPAPGVEPACPEPSCATAPEAAGN